VATRIGTIASGHCPVIDPSYHRSGEADQLHRQIRVVKEKLRRQRTKFAGHPAVAGRSGGARYSALLALTATAMRQPRNRRSSRGTPRANWCSRSTVVTGRCRAGGLGRRAKYTGTHRHCAPAGPGPSQGLAPSVWRFDRQSKQGAEIQTRQQQSAATESLSRAPFWPERAVIMELPPQSGT